MFSLPGAFLFFRDQKASVYEIWKEQTYKVNEPESYYLLEQREEDKRFLCRGLLSISWLFSKEAVLVCCARCASWSRDAEEFWKKLIANVAAGSCLAGTHVKEKT